MKLVSNLPLEFSSWNTDIAYVPGAMPANSQTARRFEISDLLRVVALSAFLGKSLADEKSAHETLPLSLRRPPISTWIKFCCDGSACHRMAGACHKKAPARGSAFRILHIYRYSSNVFVLFST